VPNFEKYGTNSKKNFEKYFFANLILINFITPFSNTKIEIESKIDKQLQLFKNVFAGKF
jgi:hypothetical protein